jgi:hypothetical protein
MVPLYLSPILYTIFIIMFVTTFVVAIGALLQLAPFDRVEPQYRDRLFWILIAEIAIIGVDLFRHIPTPYQSIILRYNVNVAYNRYSDELKDALSAEQKTVWNSYLKGQIGGKLTRKEQAIISEIKTAELNDGQNSSGEMYLNLDSKSHWLEGSFNYKFPRDQYFTHMPVVGKLLDRKGLKLELSQPERFFWDGDEVRVRPAANYSFELVRDADDGRTLTCTLVYPYQQIQIKSGIVVAKITFIEKD